MKNWFGLLACCVLVSGCAYDVPVFVDIGNSETAFLIQREGEGKQATLKSQEQLEKNRVALKRVPITYRWMKLGPSMWGTNGKYIPNEQLIIVDRKPVTREWTADQHTGTATKNQAIWVESFDSVGFTTGISVVARIVNEDDAVKFLFNYPANQERIAKLNNSYKDDYSVKVVGLEDVMDTEIRANIQRVFAREAAKIKMDELRGQKNEIMDAINKEVVAFFAERGITITSIGQFGGFNYENPEIQKAIDKVFQAQQDKNVAIAEAAAAEERKKALKATGEGEGQKKAEAAKGEAEGIKAIADAKSYELEKLSENPEAYVMLKMLEVQKANVDAWNGQYPMFLMSGSGAGMLMNMPTIDPEKMKAMQAKPKAKPAEKK